MIIGLTGSMGCGKGEVVKILQKEGFDYITLSSMVREEARKRGVPEEREKLMEIGNFMRSEDGAGVLASRAIEKIKASDCDKWIIDGIRNPAEIAELRKGKDVHIVAVNAGRDVLVERIFRRSRQSDPDVYAEIISRIERELGKGESDDGQQVAKCINDADIVIDNEGTLEELSDKFLSFYSKTQNGI